MNRDEWDTKTLVRPPEASSVRAPRVSVGLPVYNGENFLTEALDSLLAQSLREFELIISDNCSTDRTQEICARYAAMDDRIRYFRHDRNRGAAWNYNFTVGQARASYFKWAAHDDFCEPTLLEACVRRLEQDPAAVLCYPWSYTIDEAGNRTGMYTQHLEILDEAPDVRFRRLLGTHGWYHGSQAFGVMRTRTLRETGMIGCFPHADRVFLGELVLRGRFVEEPAFLFLRRIHPQISTAVNNTNRALANWYGARVGFPSLRRSFAFFRGIHRARLTFGETKACYGGALNWLIVSRTGKIRVKLGLGGPVELAEH